MLTEAPPPVFAILFAALLAVFWLVRARRRLPTKPKKPWLVLDGSNIIHWKGGTPQIKTLVEVVDYLDARGFDLGVVFDANAGYLIRGKYMHHRDFANALTLPERQIMVVPKGTSADPTILAAARDYGARVVTNDRYRDWTETFPEIRDAGHLIKGSYKSGKLLIALPMTPDHSTTHAAEA